MKNNTSLLSKVIWYDIDKDGCINKPLNYEAAVYIYMKKISFNSEACYYVGSTAQLASRISSHKCYVINWNKYKNRGSPIFYKSVLKHGWINFKFGVLEYIDLSTNTDTKQNKKIILDREQYYLDNINPSLNICKTAGSPLGVKRDIMFSINLSRSRRGKSKKLDTRVNIINKKPKIVTDESRLKISLRCKGVSVKVFDKSNNLINEFPTLTSAAKYFGVHTKTISMIYKTGKSYDNYIYKFNIKENKVWVYDSNHKLIKTLDSLKKTSEWFNIPSSTLFNYIRSGKLYKNKFYFYNAKSKTNPYLYNDC